MHTQLSVGNWFRLALICNQRRKFQQVLPIWILDLTRNSSFFRLRCLTWRLWRYLQLMSTRFGTTIIFLGVEGSWTRLSVSKFGPSMQLWILFWFFFYFYEITNLPSYTNNIWNDILTSEELPVITWILSMRLSIYQTSGEVPKNFPKVNISMVIQFILILISTIKAKKLF